VRPRVAHKAALGLVVGRVRGAGRCPRARGRHRHVQVWRVVVVWWRWVWVSGFSKFIVFFKTYNSHHNSCAQGGRTALEPKAPRAAWPEVQKQLRGRTTHVHTFFF